jgi:SAM-dependent methyltransferase
MSTWTGPSPFGAASASAGKPAVSEEAVIWALRLFAGRDPADAAEIALHQKHLSLESLRTAFLRTPEFEGFFNTASAGNRQYGVPPFLLGPPRDPAIPWRFAQPSLAAPVSQLCTSSQFDEPLFAETVATFGLRPNRHRKVWENAYIVAVLLAEGLIRPGARGLGFGCGRERIPALLASRGVEILATDAPPEETFNQGWATTNQYAASEDDLLFPEIIPEPDFRRLVRYAPVDMNAIPDLLDGHFDFCWSSCALEHLGSLRHGLDFIENSLRSLRPGGIAVHTTEFNLSSNDETIETSGLSIYRRRDIEDICLRLASAGHEVFPLNLHPGHEAIDEYIDAPPYSLPHLKLMVGKFTLTSIGLVVKKRAG